MVDKDNLFICNNHVTTVMYRGDRCPWCAFIEDVTAQRDAEYRRGFEDGVHASEEEFKKQALATKKEGKK
jgi:glutaredoxin